MNPLHTTADRVQQFINLQLKYQNAPNQLTNRRQYCPSKQLHLKPKLAAGFEVATSTSLGVLGKKVTDS